METWVALCGLSELVQKGGVLRAAVGIEKKKRPRQLPMGRIKGHASERGHANTARHEDRGAGGFS